MCIVIPHRIRAVAAAAALLVAASCGGDGSGVVTPTPDPGETVTKLTLVGGGGQTGVAGQPLPLPLVVRVADGNDRPVRNAVVNFLAKSGGSANPSQARTDTAGIARSVWTLGMPPKQELRVAGAGGTELVVAATATRAPVRATRGW